jgi:hypothetical protein
MKRTCSSTHGALARPPMARAAVATLSACVLLSVAAAALHLHDAFAPTEGPTQCAVCHVAKQPSLLAIPGPGPGLQAPVRTTEPTVAQPVHSSRYLPLQQSRAPPA